MSEAGVLDLFLFTGKEYKTILRQYHSVVGFTPIPPLFSLGYHQVYIMNIFYYFIESLEL